MEKQRPTPIKINSLPVRQGGAVDFRNNRPATQSQPIRVSAGEMPQITPSTQRETSSQKKQDVSSGDGRRFAAEKIFDIITTISLAALFFGLPIFFIGHTLQGLMFEKELYFYFWTLVGLISWISKGFTTGSLQIRKTSLDLPILLFFVAYLVSAYSSVDRWHSFFGSFLDPSRGVLSLAGLIGVYYLLMSHFSVKRAYIMIASLLASFNLVAIWFTLAVFGVHFLPESWLQFVPFSLVGSIQSTAVFAGALIPLFIAVISAVQSSTTLQNSNLRRFIVAVLCIDVVAALLLLLVSAISVPWLAMIVGSIFFLAFTLSKIIPMHGKWTWLPALTMMAMVIMYAVGPVEFIKLKNIPAPEISLPLELSWDIAQKAFQERTFLGSGPGTYAFDFSLYVPQWLNNARFLQGSGFFLEALPTIGLIGIFCLLVLMLSYLGSGLYWLFRKGERGKILSLGLWSSVIIFLVAFATIPVSGSLLLISGLIFSLAAALLMEESGVEERFKKLSFQSSPQFALALALVFLSSLLGVAFTFAFLGKMLLADISAASALRMPVNDASAADTMADAVRYMPNEGRYLTYLSQIDLMLANAEMNKSADTRNLDVIKNYIESGNSFAKAAHDKLPNDIVVQENLAQVRESILLIVGANSDMLIQAQKEYEQASALDPQNPVYYLKLGQVKKLMASSLKEEEQKTALNESKNLFQKAIEKNEYYIPAYLNLGLVQEALGDKDGAIETLSHGFNLNINSANANDLKYNVARIIRDRGKEGDTQIAEELFKSVISKDGKYVNAYLNLGLLYEKTNRPEDAISMYRKGSEALQGDPNDDNHKQIQKLIDTVSAKKKNTPEEIKDEQDVESTLTSEPQDDILSEETEEVDGTISESMPESISESTLETSAESVPQE